MGGWGRFDWEEPPLGSIGAGDLRFPRFMLRSLFQIVSSFSFFFFFKWIIYIFLNPSVLEQLVPNFCYSLTMFWRFSRLSVMI